MSRILFLLLLVQPVFIKAQTISTTPLGIVRIETQNGQPIPDEPKILASMQIIWNGSGQLNHDSDPPNEYNGVIGIERRGSSSQDIFPKKSFGLETRQLDGSNNNVSLFGMPKENDWILYGPYSDKTLIRNILAFQLARSSGHYAPRTELVELILNGSYEGVYVWMEKIKRDKGRVDIEPLGPEDNSGEDLTGGYILKVDKFTGNSGQGWTSQYPPLPGSFSTVPYQYHDPEEDELLPVQKQYIRQYIDNFEAAVAGPQLSHPDNGFAAYIDIQSFVDYQLHTELTRNVDGYRLSAFMYKDRNEKLVAGPAWDHNLSFGNADYADGERFTGWQLDIAKNHPEHCCVPYFWQRLWTSPAYADEMDCRWQILRRGAWSDQSIINYIDSLASVLNSHGVQQRNFARWSILNQYVWPNPYVGGTYQAEINHLKSWILNRLAWLDDNRVGKCGRKYSLAPPPPVPELFIAPNPFGDRIYLSGNPPSTSTFQAQLLDMQGHVIRQNEQFVRRNEAMFMQWTGLSNLSPGLYAVRWQVGDSVRIKKLWKSW